MKQLKLLLTPRSRKPFIASYLIYFRFNSLKIFLPINEIVESINRAHNVGRRKSRRKHKQSPRRRQYIIYGKQGRRSIKMQGWPSQIEFVYGKLIEGKVTAKLLAQ